MSVLAIWDTQGSGKLCATLAGVTGVTGVPKKEKNQYVKIFYIENKNSVREEKNLLLLNTEKAHHFKLVFWHTQEHTEIID